MYVNELTSLIAEHAGYRLNNQQLLTDISLQIMTGELIAIIGPNGAGKSTLLRLLTGYLSPSEGECRLQGKSLDDWAPDKLAKVRAVMRQQTHLAFPFTVKEVVKMGRSPYGKHNLKQAIDCVMAQTGSACLAERDYCQLSGGEQQRVQLARVLAQLWQTESSPTWLFLDEPTSALDLYHQQHTLRLLRTLTHQQPLAVCCVLHDLNLAALYADRIFLLYQGKLVASGTPKEVLKTETLTQWYQADLDVMPHPEHTLPQIFLRP